MTSVIEVLEVRGATVRLGIEAPRSVSIYREELWLEIKQENEAAANAQVELPTLPESLHRRAQNRCAVNRRLRMSTNPEG